MNIISDRALLNAILALDETLSAHKARVEADNLDNEQAGNEDEATQESMIAFNELVEVYKKRIVAEPALPTLARLLGRPI